MKRFEDKRLDQKTIDNLKVMIKKIAKDHEQVLEQKLMKDIFEKEKNKIYEKMQLINELINEKADKNEIKKAFIFLEDKIK